MQVAEPAINYLLPKLTALLEKFSTPETAWAYWNWWLPIMASQCCYVTRKPCEIDRTLLLKFAEQEKLMLFYKATRH